MIGYIFLIIFTVGGGALKIVQGQNPLGMFLIFIGILSAGFMGDAYGRKSGLIAELDDLPNDEEYIYWGKVIINTGNDANSTEVAVICKATDKPHKRKFISVRSFYNNQIVRGDFFTKKGRDIFIKT